MGRKTKITYSRQDPVSLDDHVQPNDVGNAELLSRDAEQQEEVRLLNLPGAHTSRTLRCVGSSADRDASRSQSDSAEKRSPLLKRYYLIHKSNGVYSAHTFAKNANVWAP